MKRYGVTIDLKGNVKYIRKYLEKKLKGVKIVSYFKIMLKDREND